MRVRRAVAIFLLVVGAGACGAGPPLRVVSGGTDTGTGTPQASGSASVVSPEPTATRSRTPTPSPAASLETPPANGRQVVTTNDSGATVRLRAGDTLEVRLDSDFDPPTASGGDVLVRTSSYGGYPTGHPVDAVFRANAAGQADVSSSTDYACLHTTPSCELPQRQWTVHVVVTTR